MEFKKLIFVLAIAFVVIFVGMWGTSYAYYVSTDGVDMEITTPDIDSDVAVVFNQNQFINMKTGVPIAANDVDEYASKSIFTLVPDSTILDSYQVAINIDLINLTIDEALKVNDFKYKLSCNDGTTDNVLSTGTGASFTNEVLNNDTLRIGSLSTSDNTFSASNSYTCTFSVWLQESGTDQNSLMNKKFSGLVKVGVAMKK